METATKELLSINKNNSDIKSTGVRFACTWNSSGWPSKEGVAAAIAQKTGKIINIVKKNNLP